MEEARKLNIVQVMDDDENDDLSFRRKKEPLTATETTIIHCKIILYQQRRNEFFLKNVLYFITRSGNIYPNSLCILRH